MSSDSLEENNQCNKDCSQSSEDNTPKKRIILVRHAESEYDREGGNNRNCKLTDYGKSCSPFLKFNVDLVICSTLRRARETLDYSGIIYKDLLYTDLCREFLDDNPTNYYNGEEIKPENADDIEKRIIDFKSMLLELQESYDTICVITHFVFLKRMTGFDFNNCFYLNYSVDK